MSEYEKTLSAIQKRCEQITSEDAEKLSGMEAELEAAKVNNEAAQVAIDKAADIETYNKALDALLKSKREIEFTEKAIDEFYAIPRMDEADYNNAVNDCKKIVADAVAEYRITVSKLLDQLVSVQDEYMHIAASTNDTLIKLDSAARVLQNKYKYKVCSYINEPDVIVPDREIWKDYAVRFNPDVACRLATHDNIGLGKAWHVAHAIMKNI